MQVINRTYIDEIKKRLQFAQAFEFKTGNLLIGSGNITDGDFSQFDDIVNRIEEVFAGQPVRLRLGLLDKNGKLNSTSEVYDFALVKDENQQMPMFFPNQQNQPNQFNGLAGIPNQQNQNPAQWIQTLNGLVEVGVQKGLQPIKSEFDSKLADIESAYKKQLAELEASRIIEAANRQKDEALADIKRAEEKLLELQAQVKEEHNQIKEKRDENLGSLKNILGMAVESLFEYGKDKLKGGLNGVEKKTAEKETTETIEEEIEDISFSEAKEEIIVKEKEIEPETEEKILSGILGQLTAEQKEKLLTKLIEDSEDSVLETETETTIEDNQQ